MIKREIRDLRGSVSFLCLVTGLFCFSGVARAADPAAAPAAADTTAAAPAEDEAIIVTGSRIARRSLDSSSPIEIIDAKQLDARGYTNIAQALNELPSFGIPGSSPVGNNQSGFGAGQDFINFLGLGSQRTLVLVNGRRFVSNNTSSIFGPTGTGGGQVDLNTIPTKLVDRIDTVAAIGAPIYGSDAIAGTVNIILKKDFQGFDIDAQNGISQQGDGQDYRVRALAGLNFAEGRGNITLAAEYNKATGLRFTDRGVTTVDTRFNTPTGASPYQQVPFTDFRVPSISTTGIPLVGGASFGLDFPFSSQQGQVFGLPAGANFGVNGPGGTQLRFTPAGGLEAIDFGNTIGPNNGFSLFTSGGNGYRLTDVENLSTDLKRYSGNLITSYQLTDSIRLFGEGWYSVSEGRNLTAQPAYNSALFAAAGTRDGNLIIPLSNPFLTAANRAAIQASIANNPFSDQNLPVTDAKGNVIAPNSLQPGHATQDYFYLGRANYDLQPGVSTAKVEVARFVGGVDGDLHVLKGHDWKYEASFNYGQSITTSANPELNQQNFLNAVNAVTNASGNIVCAPGYTNSAAPTISETCAPLNLFGSQVSKAAQNYVTSIARPESRNLQYDAIASVSGPLVTLPGGDLAFALGYEHRQESSYFDPGDFLYGTPPRVAGQPDVSSDLRGTYGRESPTDPVYGKFHTNEVFGELNANVISPSMNVPFVRELSFNSAGRYVLNSLAGNDLTYTGGVRYSPISLITFRGAYTRAIRAPSITEEFNPKSSAYFFATDPCDQVQQLTGPAPATRQANCAAAGVPAGFNALSNQRSFLGYNFGNPDLQNEKSNSFTAGFVLTPKFIKGFNATVDYVSIKLKNAISAFTPTQVVDACYDSASFPNNQFCSLVQRDASHQLINVGTTYFNSATLQYKGILADVHYNVPTPFLGQSSTMGFNLSYQYLDTLSRQDVAGSAARVLAGSTGYSHNKGVATIDYNNSGFSYQVQVSYIGPALVDPNAPTNFYSIPRIGSFTVVAMSASYDVGKNLTIHADVDNIFNQQPPANYYLAGTNPDSQPVTTYFRGILGRYFRISAAVHL